MKSAYDIIKKPVLTEKSYQDMAEKKFTFQVDVRANKTEIKQALQEGGCLPHCHLQRTRSIIIK